MKKNFLALGLILVSTNLFSQTTFSWSYNSLNPLGLAVSHTGEKIFVLCNWNMGFDDDYPGYEIYSNTGIYEIGEWGNRKIGETMTTSYDRTSLSSALGVVLFKDKKKTTKISLYAGPGIYSVKTTIEKWAIVTDDLGVLEDYVIRMSQQERKSNPMIFTSGVFLNYKNLGVGAGFNTPPMNSGAPIRWNVLLGVSF